MNFCELLMNFLLSGTAVNYHALEPQKIHAESTHFPHTETKVKKENSFQVPGVPAALEKQRAMDTGVPGIPGVPWSPWSPLDTGGRPEGAAAGSDGRRRGGDMR